MPSHTEELKEATKLVLYGWGYPALFNQPNGDRFQNRLVIFPPDASPKIEGASQEALNSVLSKLRLIKKRHRMVLKSQPSDLNPIWVWVDAPQQLTYQERLNYREQFETWVEKTKANEPLIERLLNLDILMQFPPQEQTQGWKRKAIAIAVLAVITLMMISGNG